METQNYDPPGIPAKPYPICGTWVVINVIKEEVRMGSPWTMLSADDIVTTNERLKIEFER